MIKKKTRFFLLKPLAAYIGLGLGAMAAHANPAATPQQQAPFLGPFAQIPLHLQQTVSTAGGGVKPNIVLQLDNSGSMAADIYGKEITDDDKRLKDARIEITRRALLWLLRESEFKDKANWNMTSLADLKYANNRWSEGDLWIKYNRQFVAGSAPFERSPSELSSLIENPDVFFPVGQTPSTERYLDSVYLLQKALERPGVQECQKSFVIIFSDGGQYSSSNIPMEREIQWPAKGHNKRFRIKPNAIPTDKSGFQMLFFAQQNPYYFGNNNMEFFKKKSSGGDPQTQNHLVWLESGDPPRLGWNWADFGAYLTNTDGNAGSKYFWVNREHSLGFFAQSVYQGNWYPKPQGNHNIQTFTIAFGVDDGAAHRYLSGGSVSDPNTKDPSKDFNGKVINASNEQQLKDAFAAIMTRVSESARFEPPSSFSTVSPAVSRADVTQKLPNAAAAAFLDLLHGSSEIRFYNVSGNSQRFDVDKNTWKVPSFSNRRFIINANGQNQWLQNFSGSNAYFGLPENGSNAGEWRDALVPWLMRTGDDNAINQISGNSQQYRVRETAAQRNMGDIIGSPITNYGPIENGREKFLLTAANDGMVYMFKSSSDTNHPYDLKLNYIPADMERESDKDTVATHFKHIAHPHYVRDGLNNPHRYMVNGGFTVRTMDKGSHQQIFMAGSMGQGGRGVYALNVGGPQRHTGSLVGIDAPEGDWLTSVPLFETQKGTSNTMGYPIGSPQIGRLAFGRSVEKSGDAKMTVDYKNVFQNVFVGSGVRAPGSQFTNGKDTSESALYIFNALTGVNVGVENGKPAEAGGGKQAGQLVQKLVAAANGGGLAEPAIVDINFDGIVDVVYAGDYNGGLYRFDLRDGSNWTVHKIFQTADRQPITAAPAVSRQSQNKYVVIFGTGSDLYPEDLKVDTERQPVQAVYGIHDDLTNFSPTTKGVGDLVQQDVIPTTASYKGTTVGVRKLSDKPLTGNTPAGWYFNLPDNGERVVVKPEMLLKTALIVTRQYKHKKEGDKGNVGQCSDKETERTSTTSESWVMQVKADNGGNVPGKGGQGRYAYADFLEQTNRDTRERPDEIYSVKYNGIYTFSSQLETTGDPNTPGSKDSGTTKDGDSRSGHDLQLPSGGTPNSNDDGTRGGGSDVRTDCFYDPDNKLLGQSSDSSAGINNHSTAIYGDICVNPGIRRLSWREIF